TASALLAHPTARNVRLDGTRARCPPSSWVHNAGRQCSIAGLRGLTNAGHYPAAEHGVLSRWPLPAASLAPPDTFTDVSPAHRNHGVAESGRRETMEHMDNRLTPEGSGRTEQYFVDDSPHDTPGSVD